MKVLVACLEDKSFEYTGSADGLEHSSEWPFFSMDFPRGDDWLRRLNCLSKATPVDVRKLDTAMFVLYQTCADANEFAEWLKEGREQQAYNYNHLHG
ncbi:MAG: hypothetical protein U1E71_08810 [Ramlibacter sp.]|jgi:hypothetical protein